MISPIRPITTETRRVDDVNVRATPAVAGITAARGFNQPGVVVTIGDGARTLARSGQQPSSSDPTSDTRRALETRDEAGTKSVFTSGPTDAAIEPVFDEQGANDAPGPSQEQIERSGVDDDASFNSVWESDSPSDELKASGVPYAALQRAASVQDLDVDDVAQALAHTQIAVRVLATQETSETKESSDEAEPAFVQPSDELSEQNQLSTIPTDGVPYEALQRAVTEAESAQTAADTSVAESPTEPVFLPPENGGAPWGRAVPFEEERRNVGSAAADRAGQRKERAPETQAQA